MTANVDESVSRVFVVCVLARVLRQALHEIEEGGYFRFPPTDREVQESLRKAVDDAYLYDEEWRSFYGGCRFDELDVSTYWTSPSQLDQFYAQNVGRRSKFTQLQKEGDHGGRGASLFANSVISLVLHIKSLDLGQSIDPDSLPALPVPDIPCLVGCADRDGKTFSYMQFNNCGHLSSTLSPGRRTGADETEEAPRGFTKKCPLTSSVPSPAAPGILGAGKGLIRGLFRTPDYSSILEDDHSVVGSSADDEGATGPEFPSERIHSPVPTPVHVQVVPAPPMPMPVSGVTAVTEPRPKLNIFGRSNAAATRKLGTWGAAAKQHELVLPGSQPPRVAVEEEEEGAHDDTPLLEGSPTSARAGAGWSWWSLVGA